MANYRLTDVSSRVNQESIWSATIHHYTTHAREYHFLDFLNCTL